jgi:hypothetical protein
MRSAPVRYRGVARRAVLGRPPTFHSFFENVGDKPYHIEELIKSSSLAICSRSDFEKVAHTNCGMCDRREDFFKRSKIYGIALSP